MLKPVFQSNLVDVGQSLTELFEAVRIDTDLRPEAERDLRIMISQSSLAEMLGLFDADDKLQSMIAKLPTQLRGILDDGRNGEDTSALIDTVATTSADNLFLARQWYNNLRTGQIEMELRRMIPEESSGDATILEMFVNLSAAKRLLIRVIPEWISIFLPVLCIPSRDSQLYLAENPSQLTLFALEGLAFKLCASETRNSNRMRFL